MNNVQKLLLGTANLNQMRAEIKEVTTTIASMVRRVNNPDNPRFLSNVHTTPSGVMWEVRQSNGASQAITIYCYAADAEGTHIYNSYELKMAASNLRAIHESLDSFLTWAISNFPELTKLLKPIFDAAEI